MTRRNFIRQSLIGVFLLLTLNFVAYATYKEKIRRQKLIEFAKALETPIRQGYFTKGYLEKIFQPCLTHSEVMV
jgi:hypothetical protein